LSRGPSVSQVRGSGKPSVPRSRTDAGAHRGDRVKRSGTDTLIDGPARPAARRRLLLAGLGLLWLAAIVAVVGVAAWLLWPHPTPAQVTTMPPLPRGWPTTLQLGMFSGPDEARQMQATAAFGFRYQYLAGGVNTGNGWAAWNPDGSFVTSYVRDSS